MDKLVKHGIRMLEIVEGENDFFRNDAKRQADIARAVYDVILRVQMLDRKTEPTISKMEQVDKDINVRSKTEPQLVKESTEVVKDLVKDEPQTDTEIAKEIVHKMIDDAVIAEDAYPDLRQRMHDAVDKYEPQTIAEGINSRVEMGKKEWNARHIEDEPQTERSSE